jgi:hypothetical protein
MTPLTRSLAFALGALTLAPAGLRALTTQDVQDAILGRRTFTAAELGAMDLNGDAAVDAADLVAFANPVVTANFRTGASAVEEGAGPAGPVVDFSGPFVGRLSYRVRELPAGAPSTRQVQANGTAVVLPMAAADNATIEETRTFELSLLESGEATPGYTLGTHVLHTLVQQDNDAIWNGSYENAGLSVHFQLKILRNGGAVSGTLVTDGQGIIPLNGGGSEWPLAGIALADGQFAAQVGGVLIEASATQTGVPMQRGLRFEATNGDNGGVVDPAGTIVGRATETVTAAADPYLNRTLTGGTFRLQIRIPHGVAPDPVLQ